MEAKGTALESTVAKKADPKPWTRGAIYLWGACLQQGNDPKKAYARTWGYQTSPVAAGIVCGSLLVVAKDNSETPFRVAGPG